MAWHVIDVLAAGFLQSITASSEDRTFLGGFVLQSVHAQIKQELREHYWVQVWSLAGSALPYSGPCTCILRTEESLLNTGL